jgi:hypothetical protein
MKINSKTSSTVTKNAFSLDVDGKKVVYLEYLNEKGKVIDCELHSDKGELINDTALLEEIQDFIDTNESANKIRP